MRKILLLSALLCSTALLQDARGMQSTGKHKTTKEIDKLIQHELEAIAWREMNLRYLEEKYNVKFRPKAKNPRRDRGDSCKPLEPKKRDEEVLVFTYSKKNRSIAPRKKVQPAETPNFPPPAPVAASSASRPKQEYDAYVFVRKNESGVGLYELRKLFGFLPSQSFQYKLFGRDPRSGNKQYTRE